ncbi:helix-turn-helix domain-containing protein [Aurantiacibacter zhengii]|uniref:DUF4115 domain-containing protein n=1 Tax=Aurantiacibacter zhengii TaxID=2307003 RepID=A0A418NQF8_9SPHN|nr:helix-turn-helix domain-containing protein [Aurantiacibacter zhengii]RIV85039.1 DUF4115 domain-containing protein [Aurantiacibacter zhengii]
MTDSEEETLQENTNEAAATAGAKLRAARERKGLTLEQVASETRISRRHLESLETGNLEDMPGRTYVVGFARTYAKTVGLNQEEIVGLVREELDETEANERYDQQTRRTFEPGDPSRAPGGRLLYFSLFAVVILLVGIFFAARALFAPAAEIPSLVEQQREEEAQAAAERQAEQQVDQPQEAAAAEPSGPVVFTAEGETWVRFYDEEGRVLQEGTMREGDTFTVPADAVNPQIITGRPDRLAITIGDRPVRKLSTEVETLTDVPISADALLARTGGVTTIGFGLGSPAAQEPETAESTVTSIQPRAAPAPAPAPASRPTATTAPSPTPQRSATPTATQATRTPAATASRAPTATPTPSPAATAPPRAEPAEPQDGGVSPEPQ